MLFWGSVGGIAYGYAGFPLLVLLRASARRRPVRAAPITPSLTVLVAAHNEAGVIAAKLDNLAAVDYPRELVQTIVVSDGSTDETAAIARAHPSSPLVLELQRQGKNGALNAAIEHAIGDVVVVSDADSELEPGALRALAAPFADPEVGGVAGNFRYRRSNDGGEGERAYWSFDRVLKDLQSRSGSATSSTGQLHGLRRSLWLPIPPGVADDSYESLGVVEQGHRLVYAEDAVASGDVEVEDRFEYRRKSRYIARGLRSVWLHRPLLDPRRFGWYSLQLFSHKVARRLVAVPIVLLAVVAPTLWRHGRIYRWATIAQAGAHSAAAAAWFGRDRLPGPVRKAAGIALYVDMVNVAVLRALWSLWRESPRDVWVPHRAPEEHVG